MKNPLTDLHKSLQVCARKLSIEDYALVSGTLFQLHCGYSFGYKKHDQQFLTDIHLIWKINHRINLIYFIFIYLISQIYVCEIPFRPKLHSCTAQASQRTS